MIKKAGHIITYVFLAAILLLNTTPRGFVHDLLCDHKDTIDKVDHHSKGSLHFEAEHHHCDFVQVALSVFDFNYTVFSLRALPEAHPIFGEAVIAFLFATHTHTALRGPPAVMAIA